MDFSLILNNISTEQMLIFGAFILVIAYLAVERFFDYQKKKFIPEEFNDHKAAVIFKAHLTLLYMQIRKVSEDNENSTTYKIYPSRKLQIIMIEPGLYFIDELSYRRSRSSSSQGRTQYPQEVIDTFDQEDWVSPDKKFQVPTGAFYAEQGKIVYLGDIWVFLKKRLVFKLTENLSFRLSWKHDIKDFTPILSSTKKEKHTPKSIFDKINTFFAYQPYVTKHQTGSLFHVKTWFHNKYNQIPEVPLQGKYYMPGSTIDLKRVPESKETDL